VSGFLVDLAWGAGGAIVLVLVLILIGRMGYWQ
jgi:hypothetical protein